MEDYPSFHHPEEFEPSDMVLFFWKGRVLLYPVELVVSYRGYRLSGDEPELGLPNSGKIRVKLDFISRGLNRVQVTFQGKEDRDMYTYYPSETLQRKLVNLWMDEPDSDIYDLHDVLDVAADLHANIVRQYDTMIQPTAKFEYYIRYNKESVVFSPSYRSRLIRDPDQTTGRKRTYHDLQADTVHNNKIARERFSEEAMQGKDLGEYYGYEDVEEND